MARPESQASRPLRIALIAPLVSPIAPPFLGGAQALLHDLAIGLAGRGHFVTLYASSGSFFEKPLERGLMSRLNVVEVPVDPGELRPADFQARASGNAATNDAFSRQGELFLRVFLAINRANPAFEIAHAHAFDWPAFAFGALSTVPVVHTIHIPCLDRQINSIIRVTYENTGSSSTVTVSKACAQTYLADFPFDQVIYNGVDMRQLPFKESGGDFLLFAGRMSPEKGPDLAIKIAMQAGRRLVLAGGIYDRAFFEKKIAPALHEASGITYAGVLERARLYRLMSEAEGLLFCSRWEEAFGLVLIESMATGTPAIVWRRGATPEIVTDGRTGFVVDFMDIKGAARAVEHLGTLDRYEIRRQIEARFNLDKMLDRYVDYYRQVVARRSKP